MGGWLLSTMDGGWGAREGERESRDLFDATRTRPSVKLTFQVETPQRVQVQVVAEISERHDLFFR